MNFRNILWTYKPRQNGTCNVKIYAYDDDSKDYRYFGTKVCVKPEEWDADNEIVLKKHPQHKQLNAKILEKRNEIEAHLVEDGGTIHDFGSKSNAASLLELGNRVVDQCYIEREEKGLVQLKPGTIRRYKATLNTLKRYCEHKKILDLSFGAINADFYREFKDYVFEYTRSKELVSFSNHIKIIKSLMNYGLYLRMHKNTAYQAFKRFAGKKSDKIYLSEQEMNAIESLDLRFDPFLERERDRFLVCYAFLFRFSDASERINKDSLFEMDGQKYLRVFHKKTEKQVILPVKGSILQLLEKYNYNFGFSDNPEANKAIKLIGSMAGITELTIQGGVTAPKWHFIGTHTARRTAATLLYLGGVGLKMIATLGGWSNEKNLSIYLRASGLDVAIAAKDLKHFK